MRRLVLTFVLGTAVLAARPAHAQPARAGTTPARSAWRPLIDSALSAWRGYKSDTLPGGWTVERGTLTKSKPVGDLVSRDEFGDFELQWEWKLGPGGNSGVFYRVTEQYDHPYWSGPEYQLLDDAKHPDGRNRLTAAGAAYALYPVPAGVVHPADRWNTSRLVVRGSHVEHWLNGKRVVSYDLGSPDWAARVRASKFKDYPEYGRAARGRLGIQGDHDGVLAIRHLRVRSLP